MPALTNSMETSYRWMDGFTSLLLNYAPWKLKHPETLRWSASCTIADFTTSEFGEKELGSSGEQTGKYWSLPSRRMQNKLSADLQNINLRRPDKKKYISHVEHMLELKKKRKLICNSLSSKNSIDKNYLRISRLRKLSDNTWAHTRSRFVDLQRITSHVANTEEMMPSASLYTS